MAKVVNLNKFRKRKAKADRERQAETNRRLHGRTAAERARDELQKRRLTTGLEGARLEKAAETSESSEDSEDSGPESAR